MEPIKPIDLEFNKLMQAIPAQAIINYGSPEHSKDVEKARELALSADAIAHWFQQSRLWEGRIEK